MKSKTFVMMFVAIGCGLIAAYLTARISAKQATPDSVPVLVAKEKIAAGSVIKDPEKLFVEMRYPAGSTPNAITSLDDLRNKMVGKSIQPGQWLTPDDLSTNFGLDLPKGYMAMAVKVSPETGAGGFILPKSRVNVVATVRERNGSGKTKVITVMQDVLVLAVDTMSARPEDKLAVNQLSTALLAVKPSDSQKLTLAQSMGELRLVLRAHDDENIVPLPGLEDLTADNGGFGDKPTPEAPPAPTYKLAVAKKDLEAGQVIDDPEKFFQVKTFSEVPEKAVAAEELASLKGKALKTALFKDSILTAKHFDEKVAVVVKRPEPKRLKHVMFIQNGGSTPIVKTYINGVAEGSEDSSATAANEPTAPAQPPAGSEATKTP